MKNVSIGIILVLLSSCNIVHAAEGLHVKSDRLDRRILHRLKNLEDEVTRLRKEVEYLTTMLEKRGGAWRRHRPIPSKWGCYLETFGDASVGVGATEAEAKGHAIANCKKRGQGACFASKVKCTVAK